MAAVPDLLDASTPLEPTAAEGGSVLRAPSVWVGAAVWVLASAAVVLRAGDLPFRWPAVEERSVAERVLDANAALLQVLLLMWLVVVLTRRRHAPELVTTAPSGAVARRETVLLLGYGCLALAGGFVVARGFGWFPFGLHLAGTLYGTHEAVGAAEALTWAAYNLVAYAALPLAVFRRRYSARQLGLRSSDRANDRLVIVVVLIVESVFQVLVLDPAIVDLGPRELLLGVPLTFGLYLAGAVLPAMVFVYALLLPRYRRLTGSVPAAVILGGITYAVLHLWDAWLVLDSAGDAAVSLAFLGFTYVGPGMIKGVLTLRTGNAWVHVWAYHALAPHTLVDTPHLARVFGLR